MHFTNNGRKYDEKLGSDCSLTKTWFDVRATTYYTHTHAQLTWTQEMLVFLILLDICSRLILFFECKEDTHTKAIAGIMEVMHSNGYLKIIPPRHKNWDLVTNVTAKSNIQSQFAKIFLLLNTSHGQPTSVHSVK